MPGAPLNFEPRSPRRGLLVFAALYLGPGLLAAMLLLEDHHQAPEATPGWAVQAAALLAVYLLVGAGLLLYVVLGAQRFEFTEQGLRFVSWRGRRFVAWGEVRRAELSAYRGNVELVLFTGPVRRVAIPLGSFGNGRSLLQAVAQRIPVPVAAAPAHLALVADH